MLTLVAIASWVESRTPDPIKMGLARLVGTLTYWVIPRIRRNTTANMAVVLNRPPTDPEVRDLALRSVIAYIEYMLDFLRTYRMTMADVLQQAITIEGSHHLRAFENMGRGGIMISAHFGNLELCGGLISQRRTTYAVAETFPSRSVNALLDSVRARKNVRSIQLGNAAREIIRTLQRGDFVALLADRPTPGKGVQVEFFGRPVWIPHGAATLARRTGSPLLVGGIIRHKDRSYTAYGMPPILIDPDQPAAEAVQEAMQKVMWDVEKLIRKKPSQWYMFRQMWPEAGTA